MRVEHQDDLRPAVAQEAAGILRRLSGPEREALLIKCWMSHDARWFMVVAKEFGLEVTNRLNQAAAHEVGKVEARRIVRALGLPPVTSMSDFLVVQEVLIGLAGPDLLDYWVTEVGDSAYRVHVRRCFAHENAKRAGIAEQYECGIFARVTGWIEALDLPYEMDPSLGRCLKVKGDDCVHTFSIERAAFAERASGQDRESVVLA